MTFPTISVKSELFLTNSAQHGPGTISPQKNDDFWPQKRERSKSSNFLKSILEKAAVKLQVRTEKLVF